MHLTTRHGKIGKFFFFNSRNCYNIFNITKVELERILLLFAKRNKWWQHVSLEDNEAWNILGDTIK